MVFVVKLERAHKRLTIGFWLAIVDRHSNLAGIQ